MHKLDLCGLKCPQPVLRIKRAAKLLNPGDLIEATCTDPLSEIDVPHFAAQAGHTLIAKTRGEGTFTFVIELGAS